MNTLDFQEELRKYVISVELDGVLYYAVWGADTKDAFQDKFLLFDNKICLFDSIDSIKDHSFLAKNTFKDFNIFSDWCALLDENVRLSANLPLDYIKKLVFSKDTYCFFDKGFSHELTTYLNLIGDYAYQTNSINIIKILESKTILEYKDDIYDAYFWKIDNLDINSDLTLLSDYIAKILLLDIFLFV